MIIEGIEIIHDFQFEDLNWKKDCQDKQDLDFPILYVSTRFYGRDNTARPYIYLGEKVLAELPHGEYIEGKTEAECKVKTEKWIEEKLAPVMKELKKFL